MALVKDALFRFDWPVTDKTPERVKFEPDTVANEVCPEILRLVPVACMKFNVVPLASVKFNVPIVP